MEIRTPYSYVSRRTMFVDDSVVVDVVDTSVDNVKNNVSVGSADTSKPYYTNSDVPVSLFGPGITAVTYDPNRHRGSFSANPQGSQTAAAAPSNPSAANAASNSAAGAVPSSNAATVQNS